MIIKNGWTVYSRAQFDPKTDTYLVHISGYRDGASLFGDVYEMDHYPGRPNGVCTYLGEAYNDIDMEGSWIRTDNLYDDKYLQEYIKKKEEEYLNELMIDG